MSFRDLAKHHAISPESSKSNPPHLKTNYVPFSHKSKKCATIRNWITSFKNSENFRKKQAGSDRSASGNQSSSVTLNELAMLARKSYYNFKLQQRSYTMTMITDINPNEVQVIETEAIRAQMQPSKPKTENN